MTDIQANAAQKLCAAFFRIGTGALSIKKKPGEFSENTIIISCFVNF